MSRRERRGDVARKRLQFESLEDRNMLTVGLSIDDVLVVEGNTAEFLVSLSEPSAQVVSVDCATSNGTATAGADYTAKTETLVFQPGQTSKAFTVTTLDDSIAERDETFSVVLSNNTNADIVDGTGTGTILDNEAAELSISDAQVTEGGQLVFVVTRLGNASGAASFDYATADGTAVAPDDYATSNGTRTLAAYQRTKTITVDTVDDSIAEYDETLSVNLSNATGATVVDGSGEGTIVNDECPELSVFDAGTVEEGGTLRFEVTSALSQLESGIGRRVNF
jgi:hypothetical protein